MRCTISVAVALLLGLSQPGLAADAPADLVRGHKVYDDQGCAACHSVAGVGNRRHPLDGVGARLPEETLRLWIVAPQQIAPKVRKQAFDNLSPEDLAALVAYLRSLGAREGTPTP